LLKEDNNNENKILHFASIKLILRLLNELYLLDISGVIYDSPEKFLQILEPAEETTDISLDVLIYSFPDEQISSNIYHDEIVKFLNKEANKFLYLDLQNQLRDLGLDINWFNIYSASIIKESDHGMNLPLVNFQNKFEFNGYNINTNISIILCPNFDIANNMYFNKVHSIEKQKPQPDKANFMPFDYLHPDKVFLNKFTISNLKELVLGKLNLFNNEHTTEADINNIQSSDNVDNKLIIDPIALVEENTDKLSKIKLINKYLTIILFFLSMFILFEPFVPEATYIARKTNEMIAEQITPNNQAVLGESTVKDIPENNMLNISKIGVDGNIYEGQDMQVMNKGIWRRPNSSTPDNGGNTVLVAHRYLYLSGPNTFYHLNKLRFGEEFEIYWEGKLYRYQIISIEEVEPNRLDIEDNTVEPIVTLYTCTGLNASKRLVVQAKLIN
jgi:LPXTG-site transpeptidase (sortase) family protein